MSISNTKVMVKLGNGMDTSGAAFCEGVIVGEQKSGKLTLSIILVNGKLCIAHVANLKHDVEIGMSDLSDHVGKSYYYSTHAMPLNPKWFYWISSNWGIQVTEEMIAQSKELKITEGIKEDDEAILPCLFVA